MGHQSHGINGIISISSNPEARTGRVRIDNTDTIIDTQQYHTATTTCFLTIISAIRYNTDPTLNTRGISVDKATIVMNTGHNADQLTPKHTISIIHVYNIADHASVPHGSCSGPRP